MNHDHPGSKPQPEPTRPLYSISVAAELAGVHPQTLRGWERHGLLTPARTPGGTRRYSPHDLDRATEIATLQQQGIGTNAIGRILELQAELNTLRQRTQTPDERTLNHFGEAQAIND